MEELKWRHGTSAQEAKQLLKRAIKQMGYGGYFTWDGMTSSASAGPFGMLLSADGEVTDDQIVIRRCSGMLAGRVREACREMLRELFPGGEVG